MNIALIFENATSYVIQHRQTICWNGLTNMDCQIGDGTVTYPKDGIEGPIDRHERYTLIGLGWWRPAVKDEQEIHGGRTDHIIYKARKTKKEAAICNLLTKERARNTQFGNALGHLSCYAFVSADWPISVAVAYLQAYRNTSNAVVRNPKLNQMFYRWRGYYGGVKSWMPIWDLVCNDGTDSSILAYAGDEAIRRVVKHGYLSNKGMFKDGTKKMAKSGMYRKGDQSQTIINNLEPEAPFSATLSQEGWRHRNFIQTVSQAVDSLQYTHPHRLMDRLREVAPTMDLGQLIVEAIR